MKHHELIEVANEFLKNYNMTLDVPIKFNTRLKRVLGRVIIKKSNGIYRASEIQMSVDFLQNHPKENIIDVLKHELVHYVLCTQQKPFQDGHPVFEGELRKHGIKSTNFFPQYGQLHSYKCEDCGMKIERKRKLVKTAYCSCSQRMGNLKYLGAVNRTPDPSKMASFTMKGEDG
jgi:SprT-like protein